MALPRGAAEGLGSAAGAVNAVGDWLRTTTPEEIAHDMEDFAKKQPAVFVAGALALGLIGVRFLCSTGQGGGEKKHS
jgi:hypothetical protein